MASTFVVYVDESGDEGFAFRPNAAGSSEWFILSGLVMRSVEDLAISRVIDEMRQLMNRGPKHPLHFRDLKHEQRLPYCQRIAEQWARFVAIMVHKPSIANPEIFQSERHRLYRYAARLLLERVSWYCRDIRHARDTGDGRARVTFSTRHEMSYDDVRSYIGRLQKLDTHIDWSVISPEKIDAVPHGQRKGLQLADAVASSVYYACNRTKYGFVEPSYLKLLEKLAYRRRGVCRGYGIKVWPREAVRVFDGKADLAWMDECFEK